MRILLSEDAALMRDGLVALLERAGHEVVAAVPTATDLREAVLGRDAELPDLVLSDVRMPPDHTDDGLRAAVDIRAAHPHLPILLVSQWPAGDHLQRMLESLRDTPDAGGLGYLLKDRIGHVREFLGAIDSVTGGGVVVDPHVVSGLLDRNSSRLDRLTDRERDVLAELSAGRTNQQIAAALHLSDGAVVKYVSSIFDKLEVTGEDGNRRVLAVLAYLEGTGRGRGR